MKVFWRDDALLDLKDIGYFIALDDPRAARAMLARIKAATRRLRLFPYSGPAGSAPATREVIVTPYRVVYEVDDTASAIFILNVVHCARKWPNSE